MSARDGPMLALAWSLLAAGCVSTASRQPLVSESMARPSIAVLGMTPADLELTVGDPARPAQRSFATSWIGKERGDFVRAANASLDDLVGNDATLGPTRAAERLAAGGLESRIHVALADPDPLDAGWKQRIFADAAEALERSRVVLVRTAVVCEPVKPTGERPIAAKGNGSVLVVVRLVEWPAGAEIERSSGSAAYCFEAGIAGFGGFNAGIVWPYAMGTPASEAFVVAARQALGGLTPFAKGVQR